MAEYNRAPLQFDVDDVLSYIPQMGSSRMSSVEMALTCPFCGKRGKYALNRIKGVGHCLSASCPSAGTGFNMYQLYGAVKGISNSQAIKELKSLTGMVDTGDAYKTPLPPREVYKTPETSQIASPDDRHKVYSAFLLELGLSDKNRMALQSRGFDDETIEESMFRTFPRKDEIDYFALCRRLMSKGLSLRGIPGFFQCRNGSWSFIQLTKGIIMPFRDHRNRIIALQIRKDDDLRVVDDNGELEAKCSWFSSKNCNQGCSSGSPIDFSCDFVWDGHGFRPYAPDAEYWILTEGMMKGRLIRQFWPQCPVIEVAGVDALKHLPEALNAVKASGAKGIMLAYDMDYETNENVSKAMDRTKAMIRAAGLELWRSDKGSDHFRWNTMVDIPDPECKGCTKRKPLLKGLDDYLAYKYKKVVPHIVKAV